MATNPASKVPPELYRPITRSTMSVSAASRGRAIANANATRRRRQGKTAVSSEIIDYRPHEVAFGMGVSRWRVQNPGKFPTNRDLLVILGLQGWQLVGSGFKVVPKVAGDAGYCPPELRVYLDD